MLAETAFILMMNWKGKKWALAFLPLLLYQAILKAYFKNKIVGFLNLVKVGLYVIKK